MSCLRDSDTGSPDTALPPRFPLDDSADEASYPAPPFQSSPSEPSASRPSSPRPPPFSSLYFPSDAELDHLRATVTGAEPQTLLEATPVSTVEATLEEEGQPLNTSSDYKQAVSLDKKGEAAGKGNEDEEPPPPYNEGSSPLESFNYVMAAAGGAASIITQVQQSAGPPINSLSGKK